MFTFPFNSLFKSAYVQLRLPPLPFREPDPSRRSGLQTLCSILRASQVPPDSIRKTAFPPHLHDFQTTRFYSQNCSPTTPPLSPNHENLFAKLLSRNGPTTPKPLDSIRKTALPPRPNDLQTISFYSQTCCPTTPQRPPNHENLFAKLLSRNAPTTSQPPELYAKLLSHFAPMTSKHVAEPNHVFQAIKANHQSKPSKQRIKAGNERRETKQAIKAGSENKQSKQAVKARKQSRQSQQTSKSSRQSNRNRQLGSSWLARSLLTCFLIRNKTP